MRFLIGQGFRTNIKIETSGHGTTNLFLEAAKYGNVEVVDFLYKQMQPDLKATDYKSKETALHQAIRKLEAPFSLPAQFIIGEGNGEFGRESYENRLKVIKFLTERGAPLNQTNNEGKTALQKAEEWDLKNIGQPNLVNLVAFITEKTPPAIPYFSGRDKKKSHDEKFGIDAAHAAKPILPCKSIETILKIVESPSKNASFFRPQLDLDQPSAQMVADKFDFSIKDAGKQNPLIKFNRATKESLQTAKEILSGDENLKALKASQIILIAIKNGGIANKPAALKLDLQKLGYVDEDLNKMIKEAKDFSKNFQKEMENKNIFTGNQNFKNFTGMRLKRLTPNHALEQIKQSIERFNEICETLGVKNLEDVIQPKTIATDPRASAQAECSSSRT